jgi:hypothetical protein
MHKSALFYRCPTTGHGVAWGERWYSSYSFLNLTLDVVKCHAQAMLYLWGRTSGTHWIRGWVGLTDCLETEAGGKILSPCWDWNPVIQSTARHYTDCATPAPMVCIADHISITSCTWLTMPWPTFLSLCVVLDCYFLTHEFITFFKAKNGIIYIYIYINK